MLPQLRKFCRSLGMYFTAVDLYSDFPRSAECSEVMHRLESQGILRLALEEVKLCQKMSAGVTFVVNRVQILAMSLARCNIHSSYSSINLVSFPDPM